MRPSAVLLALAMALSALSAEPARGAEEPIRVAVIVGPVGEALTRVYISIADAAARAAEAQGAHVERAYSPEADADRVLAAVEGASIVVYLGHGVGSPNPYSAQPSPATTNGWGLNGPASNGTHADSWRDGSLVYHGESWIAEHARPAPGWVMIYSNACYAPGAGEGFDEPATEEVAAARVGAYSRAPLVEMGASAYFATDFFEGAAHLVSALLTDPLVPYGEIFASEPRHQTDAVTRLSHPLVEGAETWLHRSAYFDGKVDYWYAFAGDPAASFGSSAAEPAVSAVADPEPVVPLLPSEGVVTGLASHYGESAGWEGRATIALPVEMGGSAPDGQPRRVLVCADRCVSLPVVDSCPCYVGTIEQRVANLSHHAWRLLTDAPLEEGLISIEVHLTPPSVPPEGGGRLDT